MSSCIARSLHLKTASRKKNLKLNHYSRKHLFAWIGSICLLLIIPVKAIRWVDTSVAKTFIGIAPSVLGPAGLLFLIISSSGSLSRLILLQKTIIVAVIALGLEFAQLLPRPGIFAMVRYTFDYLDVIASLVSVSLAYVVVRFVIIEKKWQENDVE